MTLDEVRASTATVLTVTQTARLLSDLDGDTPDERTVRRACEDGQLPCIRVGKRILIPREQLLALISAPNNSESAPATDAPIATLEPAEGALNQNDTRPLRSA